ncbi:hypothetical protein BC332_10790 [Capsicum chinense]|nr:hypothetical protein BC332_10790 [Capsicum chinense]
MMRMRHLRGVRKTYEACCHVRVTLKGLGVKVDEKDVSMHSGFKEELKELFGKKYAGGGFPKVFLGKKYIGGVDEIQKLNEDGHIAKFLPCETCSGSCKIYYEALYGKLELEEDDYGFQRCPNFALVRTRSNSGQNMSAIELKEVLGKWKKTRIVQLIMKQKPEFGSIRSRLFSREVTPAMDIVLEVVFYEETRLGTQAILESMSLPLFNYLYKNHQLSCR